MHPSPYPDQTQDQAHLRIIATTDLHTHILPYDYHADRPAEGQGLVRAADLIEQLRAGAAATLLLDNGDFLQGTPMGDLAAIRPPRTGATHPMIAAMNALCYDAATLGNHEFNYGLPFLWRSLAGANFPIVCANVRLDEPDGQTVLPPYVVLDRVLKDGTGREHPVRLGVIGFLPPQIMVWDEALLRGRVQADDICSTARRLVPRLRDEGLDLVVALCHSGIGGACQVEGMENAALALAAIDGIDMIVLGHSHLVFPGPSFEGLAGVDARAGALRGKPAVMPGCFGSHVGVIDLLLDRTAQGWSLAASRTAALRTGARPRSPASHAARSIKAATASAHLSTLRYIRRPVGRTACALNTFFGLLPGNRALRLIADAQQEHVAARLKGTAHAGLPILSAAAPFKLGGRGGPDHYSDVEPGGIQLRGVADLYPYPNVIRAVRVTGAQLFDWLERAASIFRVIRPGEADQPLIDPDIAPSQFDVIHGVTWQVDLSCGPGGAGPARIRDLAWNGRPVQPQDVFIVATNSYRAPALSNVEVVLTGVDLIRDVLRDHIAARAEVCPDPIPAWTFARLAGTSVLYETSPRAAAHLRALSIPAEPAGPAPGGFARFRLHL